MPPEQVQWVLTLKNLTADASRLPLSGGDHGLAYPVGSVLADLELD